MKKKCTDVDIWSLMRILVKYGTPQNTSDLQCAVSAQLHWSNTCCYRASP